MKSRRWNDLAAAAALLSTLLVSGGNACAAGLQGSYTVQGGVSDVTGAFASNFNLTQASPVTQASAISKPANATSGSGSAGFIASADAGLLDILAQATSTSGTGGSGQPVNGAFVFTGGGAFASFTDFVISGPAGATTVLASVNGSLVISGSLTDNTSANLALRGITASVSVPGGLAFNVVNSFLSESFLSTEFSLPVGQPFALGMSLKTSNSQALIASPFPTGGGAGRAGLTETLSQTATLSLGTITTFSSRGSGSSFAARDDGGDELALGAGRGTVLNLPAGYTLNSAQANIVNNVWMGPTLAVPEPQSALLLLAGGAWVLMRSRSRRAVLG